jgi:hypothetical protein
MSVPRYYNNMDTKSFMYGESQKNTEFDKLMKNIGFYQR